MSRPFSGASCVVARVSVAFGVSGCGAPSCDTSGFEELVTRDPRAIELPGVEFARVASFSPLQALGRNGETEAIAGVDASGNVEIVSRDGTSCIATTLPDDANPSRLVPAATMDLLVTMQERESSGRGRLQAFDLACEAILDFADARPVPASERLVPFRLLIETGPDLVSLDPETRDVERIERRVVSAQVAGEHVLVTTERELVVLDLALGETARHGSDVSEVLPISGGHLVIVDGTELWMHGDPESEGRLLDEDVCEVSAADGPGSSGGRFLAYFSPCEGRQLVVFDLERGVRIEVGPTTEARAVVHAGEGEGEPIVFSVAPLDAEASQLWVQEGARRDPLGPGTLAGVGTHDSDGVWIWLADGERGPLVRWSVDGVETVYPEVLGFDASPPERALVEQDGVTSLIALEGFSKPKVVASPANTTGRSGPRASIFFEDERDGAATLRLWEHGTTRVGSIGERVRVATANFWYTGETLVYEEHWDVEEEQGQFCLRVMENGDTFCEPSVASFRVMNRPERGIALVKRTGSGQRLFWAAIQ